MRGVRRRAAAWWRRRRTSRCTSASTPLSVRAAIARQPMEPGRRRRPERSVRRRHASARRDRGGAGLRARRAAAARLRRQPRASRRHRRHDAGLDAARHARSTRKACACRRCAGAPRPDRSTTCWRSSSPTRASPAEREGDLHAQWAALRVGPRACARCAERAGATGLRARRWRRCRTTPSALMRATLRALPRGTYRARDVLDDDGLGAERHPHRRRHPDRRRPRRGRLHRHGAAGRGPAEREPRRHAVGGVLRVRRAGRRGDPAERGLGAAARVVRARRESWSTPRFPAAVAGGNVETSQRIVDVLLRALARRAARPHSGRELRLDEQPRASAARRRPDRAPFAYYETIAGGAGGGPDGSGRVGGPHPHDEHPEHADRGAGGRTIRCASGATRCGADRAVVDATAAATGVIREIEFLTEPR